MFNKRFGFTIVELMVSVSIIVVMFVFVLANFRTARYGGDLNNTLSQVVDGLKTVRNMSLGGKQLTNGSFPEGGYGFYLDLNSPSQFILFFAPNIGDNYITGNEISNGIKNLDKVYFTNIYGTNNSCLANSGGDFGLPGQECWDDITAGNSVLELIFNLSGGVFSNISDVHYLGAKFKHERSGREGYFYVSTKSGLITGGFYE